jgi:hypothetical protein
VIVPAEAEIVQLPPSEHVCPFTVVDVAGTPVN